MKDDLQVCAQLTHADPFDPWDADEKLLCKRIENTWVEPPSMEYEQQ
jgi:hypothetical protein